jgi:hypothetical protein
MNRFRVPPLPDSPPAMPESDPLLEKFRHDTIKGKKLRGRRRGSADNGTDCSSIDESAPDPGPAGDAVDWGIDDTGSW